MNKYLSLFSILTFIAISASPQRAMAQKSKMLITPFDGSLNLSTNDSDYLLDTMFESALHYLHGHLSLVSKHEAKKASKTSKTGNCNEACALQAASSTGSALVLLLELNSYENHAIGFVKLLDTQNQTILSARRFKTTGQSVRAIEPELQSAIQYVLSAQFLPISSEERSILAQKQGQPTPPSAAVAPVPAATQPETTLVPQVTEPEPPQESRRDRRNREREAEQAAALDISEPSNLTTKKYAFAISSGATLAGGIVLGILGTTSLINAKKWVDDKNKLIAEQYNYRETYKDVADQTALIAGLDWYHYNILAADDKVKKNNIKGIVFLSSGGVLIITSAVLFAQFNKTRKLERMLLSKPSMQIQPVIGTNFAGAFLTKSF